MKHSLPCRALRKRPMKLGTTVILMVSAVLFSVLSRGIKICSKVSFPMHP